MAENPGDKRLPVEMINTRLGRVTSAPLALVVQTEETRAESASTNNSFKRANCFIVEINCFGVVCLETIIFQAEKPHLLNYVLCTCFTYGFADWKERLIRNAVKLNEAMQDVTSIKTT